MRHRRRASELRARSGMRTRVGRSRAYSLHRPRSDAPASPSQSIASESRVPPHLNHMSALGAPLSAMSRPGQRSLAGAAAIDSSGCGIPRPRSLPDPIDRIVAAVLGVEADRRWRTRPICGFIRPSTGQREKPAAACNPRYGSSMSILVARSPLTTSSSDGVERLCDRADDCDRRSAQRESRLSRASHVRGN
jgi:hypothetical protein